MQNLAILVWLYGAIVLAGGLIGWIKARSQPSLLSGLAFGVLLGLCGLAMWEGRWIGLTTGAGLALGLTVIMGIRFAKTKKFMPAGLVAVLSAVMLVVLSAAMLGRG